MIGNFDSFMLFYIFEQLLSFLRLYLNKPIGDVGDPPVQTAKQGNLVTPFLADRIVDEFGEFSVTEHQPSALRDPVRLILKFFGIIPIRSFKKTVFEDFGMQFGNAVDRFADKYRKVRHGKSIGRIHGHFRPFFLRTVHLRKLFFLIFVQLQNQRVNIGQDLFYRRRVPAFQCFGQDGVVGIRKGFLCDMKRFGKTDVILRM